VLNNSWIILRISAVCTFSLSIFEYYLVPKMFLKFRLCLCSLTPLRKPIIHKVSDLILMERSKTFPERVCARTHTHTYGPAMTLMLCNIMDTRKRYTGQDITTQVYGPWKCNRLYAQYKR
jgi:hypothetical protein